MHGFSFMTSFLVLWIEIAPHLHLEKQEWYLVMILKHMSFVLSPYRSPDCVGVHSLPREEEKNY